MVRLKNILVIDNDEVAIFIAKSTLLRAGITATIRTAAHGREALHILRTTGASRHYPELIIAEIQLPIMDGFAFLEELQQSPDLSKLPLSILLLSSIRPDYYADQIKNYAVLACLEKPLTLQKLIQSLNIGLAWEMDASAL